MDALHPGERLNHLPSEPSGGEQQRTAIARALITRPDVLYADEPTGALDSETGAEIRSALRGAAHTGRTIVLVTHHEDAARHADRIIRLHDGRIADSGRPATPTSSARSH